MSEAVLDRSGELRGWRGLSRPTPAPWLVALPAFAFLLVATALMLRRVEPFVNWYYLSAWYPTLLLVDAAVAVRSGRYYLISRPRFALSLLCWSAVLWFFFELVNFRVANWYYVFLPPDRPVRWFGTTVSFMTVLPAIFLAERWLASRATFESVRWPAFAVKRTLLYAIFAVGVIFAGLSLAWPRAFFALIWGALTLLLEPLNYSRDPKRSLLGDLSAGRPARALRFIVGGLSIGFIWELYNIESRSKWIYTVPGFEEIKLFEMPVLGFGGFSVFALDCFVVYQSLVLAGVAVPPELRGVGARTRRTLVAALMAAVFSFAVLAGIDRWTTDSLRPRFEELWVAGAEERQRLAESYRDVFALAQARPAAVAQTVSVDQAAAEEWVAAAQLATLRGLGMENARQLWALGVRSVAELATVDPEALSASLREVMPRPRAASPARVRVWVRAAREAAGTDST